MHRAVHHVFKFSIYQVKSLFKNLLKIVDIRMISTYISGPELIYACTIN
ncbi:39731_t:CDS:2 [Gigaspora margarita]|uniref:39731_t:CDS:1 n=1 Tax=Gigaspora margarita TaxID=4874 RepID=A0ABN7ULX3_GIGMA|nr:39731_t:CDS:2 [Gigaspora margarita]